MAVDMFLKIEGVEGESQSRGHEKWIEIESFSWGATNSGGQAHGAGGGGGAGKVSMHDISFVHAYDKASPKLLESCCQGRHIKSAILSVRKAGSEQHDYLIYKLTDLLVSSLQVGGTSNEAPAEQVSLNFSKFEITFRDDQGEETETAFCDAKTGKSGSAK